MGENNRESSTRVSLLKYYVKKMLKRDLEIQSIRTFFLLCFLLSAIPSSPHLKTKNNLDCEKTLKLQHPQDKPLLGTPVNQNSPSATHWRMIFGLQMTSAIARSAIYLQAVLKMTNKTSVSIFGVWLHWFLSSWGMVRKPRIKQRAELGLLNVISDKAHSQSFSLTRKVTAVTATVEWCYKLSSVRLSE